MWCLQSPRDISQPPSNPFIFHWIPNQKDKSNYLWWVITLSAAMKTYTCWMQAFLAEPGQHCTRQPHAQTSSLDLLTLTAALMTGFVFHILIFWSRDNQSSRSCRSKTSCNIPSFIEYLCLRCSFPGRSSDIKKVSSLILQQIQMFLTRRSCNLFTLMCNAAFRD